MDGALLCLVVGFSDGLFDRELLGALVGRVTRESLDGDEVTGTLDTATGACVGLDDKGKFVEGVEVIGLKVSEFGRFVGDSFVGCVVTFAIGV